MFYDTRRYLLKRGAVAVFRPYELHYGESADLGDYERYVVNFSEEYIKKVLGSEEKAADILSQIKSGIFYLSESQTEFIFTLLLLTTYALRMSQIRRHRLILFMSSAQWSRL